MLRLGVLDQWRDPGGGPRAATSQETVELAQAGDRLGFHRYWLAEHHSTPGLAGSSPEILIGQVAARTRRIRVGSGGVMLQHYSPLKVAENFRVLEAVFPGGIDLGIGRAPGSDQIAARALQEAGGAPGFDRFPEQVADLIAFLHDALPADHRFRAVKAMPTGPTAPEIWLLGSSDGSAAIAAGLGTAFSFAHFINPDGGAEITRAYTRQFQPSATLDAPRASAAIFVVCADTRAEAQRLARSRELFLLRLYTGRAGRYPTAGEAESYPYTAREAAFVEALRARSVVGTPEQVHERLVAVAGDSGVGELVLLTITHEPKARLRSYALLAQASSP